MTTVVPNKFNVPTSLAITAAHPDTDEIHFKIEGRSELRMLNVSRTAFLNAARTELGVTIFDKADLPIVTDRGDRNVLHVGDQPWGQIAQADPAELRRSAYDRLALADYLEAHPRVDPEAHAALTSVIDHLGRDWADLSEADLARRLLATGRIEVKA